MPVQTCKLFKVLFITLNILVLLFYKTCLRKIIFDLYNVLINTIHLVVPNK